MVAREFIVSTRQQQQWGWLLILDFFLAGAGASSFAIALIMGFVPGMVIGGSLVLVGALILLVDLSRRRSLWRLVSRLKYSWLSRGTIGILVFTVLALVHISYLTLQPNGWASLGAPWLAGPVWVMVLGIVTGVVAIFVASYPGFLLGGMRRVPLWNSAYTPALFLVSALLGGLGIVYLSFSSWTELSWSLAFLENLGIGLVAAELFLLLSLLVIHPETATASVRLLTHGSLRFHFFIGVLGLGLVIPLIILASVYADVGTASLLPIAGVFLLTGLFVLRYIIIRAGIYVSPV